jgi:hypothetical protein
VLRSLTSSFTTPSAALSAEPTSERWPPTQCKGQLWSSRRACGDSRDGIGAGGPILEHIPADSRWPNRDRFFIHRLAAASGKG